jgi:hypothetical protein
LLRFWIRQAHERLGKTIHGLGGLLGVGELVAAQLGEAVVDVLLDAGGVHLAGTQAQKGVMIGRPISRRQSKPGANLVVFHGAKLSIWGDGLSL